MALFLLLSVLRRGGGGSRKPVESALKEIGYSQFLARLAVAGAVRNVLVGSNAHLLTFTDAEGAEMITRHVPSLSLSLCLPSANN